MNGYEAIGYVLVGLIVSFILLNVFACISMYSEYREIGLTRKQAALLVWHVYFE